MSTEQCARALQTRWNCGSDSGVPSRTPCALETWCIYGTACFWKLNHLYCRVDSITRRLHWQGGMSKANNEVLPGLQARLKHQPHPLTKATNTWPNTWPNRISITAHPDLLATLQPCPDSASIRLRLRLPTISIVPWRKDSRCSP